MKGALTRTQVCHALGVSEKTLYLWEKAGKVVPPPRDHRGWRSYREEDVAALRLLVRPAAAERVPGDEPHPSHDPEALEGLTARNRLVGVVVSVRGEGILSEVVVRLGDGQEIVSVVTSRSVQRLGLRVGEQATAVIKSTEVMLFR